jgi:phosphoribosyl-ATP pyrophosphohydrolase
MARAILEELQELIFDRKRNPRQDSYTCSLFDKGKAEILKKVGEEATEVIVASVLEGRDRVVYESADLLYHLLVLLAEEGISLEEVFEELERRFGKSGLRLKD